MGQTKYRLVIGNKNYSSWSLRPWLLMKRFGISFDEIAVNLKGPTRQQELDKNSPSGLVPALWDGDLLIWDSLAIAEYLADTDDGLPLWPEDHGAKAIARSVSAEMHSRFFHLRDEMPMDFARILPAANISDGVAGDIRRIVDIWRFCRENFGSGGEFLFGGFSIADAMYAPVASRFRTYDVNLSEYGDDGIAAQYAKDIFEMPEIGEWGVASAEEIRNEEG